MLKQARRADVMYALDTVSVGFPVRLASLVTGVPYVLRVPGDYAWEQGTYRFSVTSTLDDFVRSPASHPLVWLMRRLQLSVARGARSIIVPSAYLRGIVQMWGIPERNITVVYSSPEPLPTPSRSDARAALGIFGQLIVGAGRLVPWKGFDALVCAMRRVALRFPEVQLVIIGGGPEEAHLRAIAKREGVADCVRFTGNISRDELGRWIAAADVFALPTSYEGFSHQLVEVMRIGVPVITTPVGGNTELVRDTVSGLLVPPKDEVRLVEAIISILEDPVLAARLVEGARARVAEMNDDESVSLIENVLRSAVRS